MTRDDDDIVRAFVRRALAAGMPRDAAAQVDRDLRAVFGGDRHYVPRRPAEGKAGILAEALTTGTTIQGAIDVLGWHRATVYRALRRRWVTGY